MDETRVLQDSKALTHSAIGQHHKLLTRNAVAQVNVMSQVIAPEVLISTFTFPLRTRSRSRGCCTGDRAPLRGLHVGSKADIKPLSHDVRFTPNSGHQTVRPRCPLCAINGHRDVKAQCPLLPQKRTL